MRDLGRVRGLALVSAVLVLCGSGTAALLVHLLHLENASSTIQILGFPIALVACYFTLIQVLPRGPGPGPRTLPATADRLAIAIARQWTSEASVRRLHDPYPLPVSWSAVPGQEDGWHDLADIVSGWEADLRSDPSRWAAGPGGLAGSEPELHDVVMARVPTRRLVVLGEAGSGKTVLMIRLVLRLVRERGPGDPVPILVSLASWNPSQQDFRSWAEERLILDHPALGERPGEGADAVTRARWLLDFNKIILVLDALDEIPDHLRNRAIGRINHALRPGQTVVLACRWTDSGDTIPPILGAAVVRIEDLNADQIERYLRDDAMSDVLAQRWEPVFAALRQDTPLAAALRTPLTVTLSRTIYSPRSDEPSEHVPDPAALCNTEAFPSAAAIEDHLLDALVAAAYRGRDGTGRAQAKAERWLSFLARHLQDTLAGSSDLKWWELRHALPRGLISGVAGLLAGIPAGVAATAGGERLGIGIGVGLIVGLSGALLGRRLAGGGNLSTAFTAGACGGLVGGLCSGLLQQVMGLDVPPTIGLIGGIEVGLAVAPLGRPLGGALGGFLGGLAVGFCAQRGSGLTAGLVDGVAVALTVALTVEFEGLRSPAQGLKKLQWSATGMLAGGGVGLAVGLTLAVGPRVGIVPSLLAALATGLATGVVAGIDGSSLDLSEANRPSLSFAVDLRTCCLTGGAAAGALGLVAGLGISPGVGFAAAIGYGLTVAFIQASAGPFAIAWAWLVLTGRLPFRTFRFLSDAHRKYDVFRQIGSAYQFRHVNLQLRLARHPNP